MNPIIEANRPRPQRNIPRYVVELPTQSVLTERQLRTLIQAESDQALALARAVGVETPDEKH